MDGRIFLKYISLCEENNWKPTWSGASAFEAQVKIGLRDKWAH